MKTDSSKSQSSKLSMSEILDATGWGLFLIWIGIASLATVGWGIAFTGIGVLLLSAQAVRKYYKMKVSTLAVVFGIIFILAGVVRIFNIDLEKTGYANWILPILFIVAGVSIFVSMWMRRGRE